MATPKEKNDEGWVRYPFKMLVTDIKTYENYEEIRVKGHFQGTIPRQGDNVMIQRGDELFTGTITRIITGQDSGLPFFRANEIIMGIKDTKLTRPPDTIITVAGPPKHKKIEYDITISGSGWVECIKGQDKDDKTDTD